MEILDLRNKSSDELKQIYLNYMAASPKYYMDGVILYDKNNENDLKRMSIPELKNLYTNLFKLSEIFTNTAKKRNIFTFEKEVLKHLRNKEMQRRIRNEERKIQDELFVDLNDAITTGNFNFGKRSPKRRSPKRRSPVKRQTRSPRRSTKRR